MVLVVSKDMRKPICKIFFIRDMYWGEKKTYMKDTPYDLVIEKGSLWVRNGIGYKELKDFPKELYFLVELEKVGEVLESFKQEEE